MFRNLGRSLLLSLLVLAVGAAGLALQATVALAASGDVSGTIFVDENEDGANVGEQGLAGVVATAYDAQGIAAGSATSDSNGDYTISGLDDGAQYRIEFTNLPTDYSEGPVGADSESSVTFATPESAGVDFGAVVPEVCRQPPANALLRTYAASVSCSAVVDPALPKDAFGLLDISSTVPATGRQNQTTTTPMFHHPDWHIDQLGNLFGTAIDNTRGDMFATASSNYSHRFYTNAAAGSRDAITQYGAIGGGANDLGAAGTVYKMDAVSGAPSVLVQLPQQTATFTHQDCEDNDTLTRTSGVGLGNIVYDETNDQLFVSNWEDGHIYRIAMDGTILDAYDVDVNDDGSAGMANGRVPYALETSNDGTRLYWGTVSGVEVWSVDLTTDGGFTGPSSTVGGVTIHRDSASETLNQTIAISTAGEPDPAFLNNNLTHFVSDLEIIPSGEMLAGLRVGCDDNPHAAYNHQGQTHRLTANGAGLFTGDDGALNVSETGDAGLEDNYGGVDFYNNPSTGTTQYAVTSADVLSEAGPHGLAVLASSAPTAGLATPLGAIDYGTPNDPKGIAGDVSVFNLQVCTPSGVEIGNRVWFDLDNNGIQDPGEQPLAGVEVTLYAADGSTVLATTTTSADGTYIFDGASGVAPNTDYVLGFDASTTTSPLPGGVSPSDLEPTMANVGSTSNPDATDSDLVGTTIPVTTGGPGENDHTFDAGFTLPYDLALTKVYTSDSFEDTTDGAIEDGSDVTFTITVTNQGLIDATTFEVTDYLPSGFELSASEVAAGNWTDNADGTATITSGPLAAGASTDITITLTANGAAQGEAVNWAEISADDGNDVDSIPDSNIADDAQPAGPGAPTDNVVDNTLDGNGVADSDDHDPAGVTVEVYDLALTKAYTSDTFGNTTDGVIEMGADVTFTITVTNQGTLDAATFEVTDYLPSGFDLSASEVAAGNWSDNADGTATFSGGPLAAGASTDITITTTATSSGAGDIVNWAEISADDGNDADSTTDTVQANDNQPAAPGAPTDNVIDNTLDGNGAADEDDHDPAGVTVEAYDLALTKVYTSDTFGNTTDAVIGDGADVTFTITVTNQGTVDATTFTVTDYIPAGFDLNDGAWTDNADGTASIDAGPLAAGASTDITITLTANGAAAGEAVNWAEISADDGNDVDSTPDANIADDAQPAAPGAPTDDVIDNTLDGNGVADSDDHDPAGVSVGTYDLALQKVYTSDSSGNSTDGVIEDGADVTFTITVTNQGTLDAATFDVTDYFPAGFDLSAAEVAAGNWSDNADGTATFSGGPLAAGASTDITITLTANGAAVGDAVNWAEISADDGIDVDSTTDTTQGNDAQPAGPGAPTDDVVDGTAGDEDDHDPAGVTVANYDLALQKVYTSDTTAPTADGVVSPGGDVIFTITVTNQGTTDATTFEVTDYLPSGFDLSAAEVAAGNWTDNADGTATFSGGPLAAGASTDITIRLTANGAPNGDYVNWAEISADDGNDVDSIPDATIGNDAQPAGPGAPTDDVIDNTAGDEDDHDPAGITVATYDLALQKVYTSDNFANTTDGIIENGSDVTFTITVTNQGTIDATTFTVTDYLPAGFTLNDAAWTDNGATASIDAGPLAAGASTDITITMTATSTTPGSFENWAEISADDGVDVDSTPDAVQANDNQPAAPGEPTDDVIDNTAGDEDDHDVAGVSIANFDLALTKVYTSDSSANPTDGAIAPDGDVTFTITVTNQGTLDAATFEVTDYFPAGFDLSAAEVAAGDWADNADGTATFTGGPLAAGASTDITITLTANGVANGDYVNWAEISSDSGNDIDSTPDATIGNDAQPAGPGAPTDNVIDNTPDGNGVADEDDHDPAGITVETYDLALIKVFTSDTFANTTDGVLENGTDATFTITVTNQGSVQANTFTVTDYLPAGFILNDAAWSDNADGTADFTGGPLAPGASTDITITMTATTAIDGVSVNWAEISADDGIDIDSTPDTNPNNDNQPAAPGAPTDNVIDGTAGDEDDQDPAGVTIQSYDLALQKVYTSDTTGAATDGVVEIGDDVTFTITVTNQGTLDATTFTVTDYLPAGFVLNDAAWTDNGATASIDAGPLAAGASTDITITLTAATAPTGDHVNWAEISADDGNDIDSTPDANIADDAQPAGPGAPTDNVVDNTAGDSDDHDPAGITVEAYDLALQKVYTSDTAGAPTDGVIELGADVTFTL